MENLVKISMYKRFFVESILKAFHILKKYIYGVYIKEYSQKSACNSTLKTFHYSRAAVTWQNLIIFHMPFGIR